MWFLKLLNQFDENVEYHIIKIRVKNKVKYKRIQPLVAHGQVQCGPSPLCSVSVAPRCCARNTHYYQVGCALQNTWATMGFAIRSLLIFRTMHRSRWPNHQMASWCSVPYEALDAKAISNHSPSSTPPNILFTIFYYLHPKNSSPITHSLQPFPL